MCLKIDSDASYLVAPRSKSRIGGYFYLGSHPISPKFTPPCLNGPIHIECKLLKHVVSSAAEAETSGIFQNCQAAIPIQRMLHTLGHPQPPTPIKTDNKTASAFANNTLQSKRSKSWDMRYFWIKDKITEGEFLVYWDKGLHNFADYFTKHFPPNYHQKIRSTYVLQGHCITLPLIS